MDVLDLGFVTQYSGPLETGDANTFWYLVAFGVVKCEHMVMVV